VDDDGEIKQFFTIPYIMSVFEKFKKMAKKKHSLNLAFASHNSLSKYIKTRKDQLDPLSRCCVVYKISCHECEASYVGQTKRLLKTRVKEHRTYIKKSSDSPSVLSDHRLELHLDFD